MEGVLRTFAGRIGGRKVRGEGAVLCCRASEWCSRISQQKRKEEKGGPGGGWGQAQMCSEAASPAGAGASDVCYVAVVLATRQQSLAGPGEAFLGG